MDHTRLPGWLLLPAVLAFASPALAQQGDFAPGDALRFSLAAADAEMVLEFAMDSSHLAGQLPAGFRPYTLRDLASRGDSLVGALLRLRPDYASRVIATFSVAKVDSAAIGADARGGRGNVLAYWWVPVQVDSAVVRDDGRAKNGEAVLELGFWSADGDLARQLGAVMPNVARASVRMSADGDGTWHGELRDGGTHIVASCQPVGESRPLGYATPAYVTVWAGGNRPGPLAVYTYQGHHTQPCITAVDAQGGTPLARALHDAVMFGGSNYSGWRARVAAYARK